MPKTNAKLVENEETNEVEDQKETLSQVENTEGNSAEIIDLEWDQIQPIFEFRERLVNLENYFARMCLEFEKNKANLMNQIVYGEADLYAMAQSLQKEANVNENLSYELKLPTEPGEKGFFVRKDN
jgi:hypothetical protein|tara:strand:+ start:3489 stop:3866 length:378 start_codon:yes stop_codon:yes gene_type:complete